VDYSSIIEEYYSDNNKLKDILLVHSESVMRKALQIVDKHPELHADRDFIVEASMLHDVGIFLTDAPGIECHGKYPYISHGILGGQLLRQKGFQRHARVCERHTGTGISAEDILHGVDKGGTMYQDLRRILEGIDPDEGFADFFPETIEEKIVCYADKFFSKSHLDIEKSLEQVERSLMKFGYDNVMRFREWHSLFC